MCLAFVSSIIATSGKIYDKCCVGWPLSLSLFNSTRTASRKITYRPLLIIIRVLYSNALYNGTDKSLGLTPPRSIQCMSTAFLKEQGWTFSCVIGACTFIFFCFVMSSLSRDFVQAPLVPGLLRVYNVLVLWIASKQVTSCSSQSTMRRGQGKPFQTTPHGKHASK